MRDISFALHSKEVLGIAGVDGNGQRELVEALTGLRRVQKGCILLDGKDITNESPLSIRRAGLAHVPEDRNTRGLNRVASIKLNQIVVRHREKIISDNGVLNKAKMQRFSQKLIEQNDVRPPIPDASTSHFSGGNAQKVVLSRELDTNARLLIAAQPTRGVDIGAIEQIRAAILRAVKNGSGVLLVSADLEEILALSDRIIVMYEGRIAGEMKVEEANEENLGLMMTGGAL